MVDRISTKLISQSGLHVSNIINRLNYLNNIIGDNICLKSDVNTLSLEYFYKYYLVFLLSFFWRKNILKTEQYLQQMFMIQWLSATPIKPRPLINDNHDSHESFKSTPKRWTQDQFSASIAFYFIVIISKYS